MAGCAALSCPMNGAPHDAQSTPDETPDSITQNIESIDAFYQREDRKISESQRVVEAISSVLGRPIFLVCIISFVTLWILANVGGTIHRAGKRGSPRHAK